MVFVANGLTVSREETGGDITVLIMLENIMLFQYDKETSTELTVTMAYDLVGSNITMLTDINIIGSAQAIIITLAGIDIVRFDDTNFTRIADTWFAIANSTMLSHTNHIDAMVADIIMFPNTKFTMHVYVISTMLSHVNHPDMLEAVTIMLFDTNITMYIFYLSLVSQQFQSRPEVVGINYKTRIAKLEIPQTCLQLSYYARFITGTYLVGH